MYFFFIPQIINPKQQASIYKKVNSFFLIPAYRSVNKEKSHRYDTL